MSNVKPTDNLNISLEPHLVDALRDLRPVVPHDLADTLSQYTASTPPPTIPYSDPEEIEAANSAERKSITSLLNGLLSVLGSGFAVWWAADKLRWKNEWRVLLALFASIVVAVAEAVLYLIWQSRLSNSKRTKPRHKVRRQLEKNNDFNGTETSSKEKPATISTSIEEVTDAGLRRRQ
ncbi:hypothetical protein H2248_010838 [Termitomyces sp. 'cryptogamus']|nr:hypothetical protein H2248_010838 [Termitomyces sp. 'cryptogamus']